jgi:hypothetical protein
VRPTFLEGAQRLALEIDDPVAVGTDEHLAQVVVAVDPREPRRRTERLEDRELRGDRGGTVVQQLTRLACVTSAARTNWRWRAARPCPQPGVRVARVA